MNKISLDQLIEQKDYLGLFETNISVAAIIRLLEELAGGLIKTDDLYQIIMTWNDESKKRKVQSRAKRQDAKTPPTKQTVQEAGKSVETKPGQIPVQKIRDIAKSTLEDLRAHQTLLARHLQLLNPLDATSISNTMLEIQRNYAKREAITDLLIKLEVLSVELHEDDFDYGGKYYHIYEKWVRQSSYPYDIDTWLIFINQLFKPEAQDENPTSIGLDIAEMLLEEAK